MKNVEKSEKKEGDLARYSATFIGHSTLLLDMGGFKILTDPILERWVYFIPRIRGAKMKIGDINENVELILVSHPHSDHLNKKTMKKISPSIPVATHTSNRKYVEKCEFDKIIVFDYWEKKEFSSANLAVTLIPASHAKTSPWGPLGASGGFVIESARKNIYFAGDTSFSKDIFEEIGKRFKIDIAFLPVGSYLPRLMLKNEHMSPQEAIEAFRIIGAETMIPIHWGSFMLAFDTPGKSIKVLKKKIRETDLENKVVILKNGESFYF